MDSGLVVVVAVIAVVALVWAMNKTARVRARLESIQKAALMNEIFNEVLRSWAAHSVNERIDGLPIRIETEWNPDFDWLRKVTVVVRQGFQEVRYDAVLRDHLLKRPGGQLHIVGALTFEPVGE